ncbi:MAG: T4 RnlA family RNA ligase [Bacteroidia bacterium]
MKNIALLQQMIAEEYINVQIHPTFPLKIYNYSAKTQYDYLWNEWTKACRGLITDENFNVVARPFDKFFNMEELSADQIPKESFEVYEKMDGSLGILYWWEEKPYIATRGSFASEQAIKANEILQQKYAHTFGNLDKSKTYLFEIIYPENRIIIDYGEKEDLVLLAIIDTATGADVPLQEIGFPLVKRYNGITSLAELAENQEENREGYVIKFKNGFRMKVKFQEYVRLHRFLDHLSSTVIWEHLSEKKSLDELLNVTPDEFYTWVKKMETDLRAAFQQVEQHAKSEFKDLGNRKENAAYYLAHTTYPQIMFKMLDNMNYDYIIWKLVRPAYSKPTYL